MWLPAVVGNGYEPLNDILDSGISITGVAVLVIAKIVAPSASVTSGIPGVFYADAPGGSGTRRGLVDHGEPSAVSDPGSYALVRHGCSVGGQHSRVIDGRNHGVRVVRRLPHRSPPDPVDGRGHRCIDALRVGGRRRDRPHPGWRAAPARGAGGRLPADGRHVGHPCSTIRPPATKASSGPISIRSADRSSSMRRARTSATAPTYSRPTSAGSSRLGRCL